MNWETCQGDIFFPSEQFISINWCFLMKPNVFFLIKIVWISNRGPRTVLFFSDVNWWHKHLGEVQFLGSSTDSATIVPDLSRVKHRYSALGQSLNLLVLLLSLTDVWWRQVVMYITLFYQSRFIGTSYLSCEPPNICKQFEKREILVVIKNYMVLRKIKIIAIFTKPH